MVKPNTVGNTGAASGNAGQWEGLTSMKMGEAANKKVEGVKSSIASKFEKWREKRAFAKSENVVEHAIQERDTLQKDVEEKLADKNQLETEYKASQDKNTELKKKVDSIESSKEYRDAEKNIKDARKEYDKSENIERHGKYTKDQAKRVFELLKAGGDVIKSSVRSFWKGNPKISVGDLAMAVINEEKKVGSGENANKNANKKANKKAEPKETNVIDDFISKLPEKTRQKFNEAKNAKQEKEDAKNKFSEIWKGFGERKKTYKANIEKKAEAKKVFEEAKEKMDQLIDKVNEAKDAYNESSLNLKKIKSEYEDASNAHAKAKEAYDNAVEKFEEAGNKSKEAKEIIDLHEALGKKSPKVLKAEVEEKRDKIQERVNEEIEDACLLLGVEKYEDIPEDKRAILDKRLKRAGQDELNALNAQLQTIEQYETAKKAQAEAVASAPVVKRGIRSFFPSLFTRNHAYASIVGEEEEEEEEE